MELRGAVAAILPYSLIMMLAAVVACQAAIAQSAFEPVAQDPAQTQIVERIHAIQTQDGDDSEALIVPFTELALLYEQAGELALANAATDQALYLIRVNHGLYSLDQAPLLRQAIGNDEASGNLASAWTRQEELVALARRHPEDLRTVPIFREVADKRMALFEAFTAGERPEQLIHGDYCEQFGQLFSCSRRDTARALIGDAQMYYADAIGALQRNQLYSSDELQALETELVRSSDVVRLRPELAMPQGYPAPGSHARLDEPRGLGHDELERYGTGADDRMYRDETAARLQQLGPRGARDEAATEVDAESPSTSQAFPSYYLFGRQSLVRLFDYAVASSAPLPDQLRAFAQIADWDLLYSRNAFALGEYEQVYALLEENGGAQALTEELFAPQLPIVLPSFGPNPLDSEQAEASTGYIDVAFRITKLGEPQRIEILDSTAAATEAAQEQLVRLIKASRFRPRVTDGEFGTSSVVVRYHSNDGQPVGAQNDAPLDQPGAP